MKSGAAPCDGKGNGADRPGGIFPDRRGSAGRRARNGSADRVRPGAGTGSARPRARAGPCSLKSSEHTVLDPEQRSVYLEAALRGGQQFVRDPAAQMALGRGEPVLGIELEEFVRQYADLVERDIIREGLAVRSVCVHASTAIRADSTRVMPARDALKMRVTSALRPSVWETAAAPRPGRGRSGARRPWGIGCPVPGWQPAS